MSGGASDNALRRRTVRGLVWRDDVDLVEDGRDVDEEREPEPDEQRARRGAASRRGRRGRFGLHGRS